MQIEKIKNLNLTAIEESYTARDTILYALGLGYGNDPKDADELAYVFEESLKAVPSISCVWCHPGFWLQKPEFEVDWMKILHAEQEFTIHSPLPATGKIRGTYHVGGIEDKGAGKGALLHQYKELYLAGTGEHLATVRSTLFMRGNGGEGGFGEKPQPASALPERAPDRVVEIPTSDRAALIYRLSGDWNPLHANPEIARKAGFEKPILQGLCTLGIACRAILETYCDQDPVKLESMFVRFSSPVYPGETVRIEFYEEGETLRFRAVVVERQVTVLDRCSAQLKGI